MKGGVILVLIALVTITGSKLLSELYLTEKTETEHFIFSWTKDEAQFFNCLPAAVEENYQRISKDLNSTASGKITIKLYDNSWIYNLSIGNPLIRGWWHEGIAGYEHLMPLKDHDEFKERIESTKQTIKNRVITGNIPTFE